MSKARPDLDNSVAGAKKAAEWLSSFGFVQSVWLGGSRSPIRKRQHTDVSDWDLVAVVDRKNITMPALRDTGFHADLLLVDRVLPESQKLVMLWPVDTHGVLDGD